MKKPIILVVVIIALALLLLPPVLGGIAKTNLDATLARAATQSAGVMDLQVVNYDRGWFASRADFQISFTDAYLDANPALTSLEPSVIELREALANGLTQSVAIAHGPLFFTTRPGMGLGEISSEFAGGDSQVLRSLLAKTGNAYFVKTTSRIGFTGAGPIEVEMPGFDINDPALELDRLFFAGMYGRGTLDYGDMHVVLNGDMDGLSLESKSADVVVEKTSFAIDAATPASAPFGIGTGKITIDAITGILNDTFALDLDQLVLEFTSTQNANGTAAAAMSYSIRQAKIDQSTLSDVELSMRMRNLNADAWTQLQQVNMTNQPTAAADTLTDPVYALLKDGAGLSLDPLRFIYDGQIFKANLSIDTKPENLPPRAAFSLDNPLLFINLFRLDLALLIDKNLAATLAVSQLKQQLAEIEAEGTDDAQLQQMAESQSPIMLEMLVSQGMLKDEGKNYSVTAQYDNGAMMVNGQPLPIGQMLQGGAQQ